MKQFWVDVRPWRKELATTAIESGADVLVVDQAQNARELGRITTVAPDGDLVPGKDVFAVTITDKQSETEAINLSRKGPVLVETSDWTIIPLENLVSRSDRIFAVVKNVDEAAVALRVLERGTAGILLRTGDPAVIRDVAKLVQSGEGAVSLVPFTVTKIVQVGMGDRVCVDTCSMMTEGEGMLVGNTSSAMLLVHAETLENPYVAPRPFRVNAGAVHAYVMGEEGRTPYLSDLKTGDHLVVIDAQGHARDAVVGRVKIERRPLLLVEAESEGSRVSLVLQNAETIRLVGEDGKAISVAQIKVGDRVLGAAMGGGRHFGVAVKETIVEK
jgi:3-dehydroquinate synthase II